MASDERKDKKLLTVRGPTSYEICEVLRVAKKDVNNLLERAETKELNRNQICKINRYLRSIILLELANRPSSVEGLTHRLVELWMAHKRSKTSAENEVVSINSPQNL